MRVFTRGKKFPRTKKQKARNESRVTRGLKANAAERESNLRRMEAKRRLRGE